MIVLDEINISEAETFDFDITNNKILESKSNKKLTIPVMWRPSLSRRRQRDLALKRFALRSHISKHLFKPGKMQ